MADEAWKLEPFCVFGGYQLRWVRWRYMSSGGTSGWDHEDEPYEADLSVYPTREAAERRIEEVSA